MLWVSLGNGSMEVSAALAEPRVPAPPDDDANFRKRGSLLWNQQDGSLSLSQRQLSEEERSRLRVRAVVRGFVGWVHPSCTPTHIPGGVQGTELW